MNKILITLDNLKTFLKDLKVFIKDYFDSRIDSELSTTSTNPVQNKVITDRFGKSHFKGTKAELEEAIQAGLIQDYTIIQVTDDEGEETIIVEATMQQIYDLFGLVYEG